MNVVETIQAVRSAGGSVSVNGGSVIVDAPPTMPAAIWEALATHKATLLDLLTPSVTYAELAAQEEREAIQAEAQAPVDAVTFGRSPAARRCRLLRDTPWESPNLGRVTFPAGLMGVIVDDLSKVENTVDRLALSWLLAADRGAGKNTLAVLIDGRPRVLEAASVEVLPIEGDSL